MATAWYAKYFQITLQDATNGATYLLNVFPEEKLGSAMSQASTTYFQGGRVMFVFGGRKLNPDETVGECGITPDAVVQIVSAPAATAPQPSPEMPPEMSQEIQQITQILERLHQRVHGTEARIGQLHGLLENMQRELQQAVQLSK